MLKLLIIHRMCYNCGKEMGGTISKNVDVEYFPFEVTNKEKMAIEIVKEIAPNAEN